MNSPFAVWTLALALAAPGDKPKTIAADPARPVIQNCLVSLIEEVQIPAQEAGVLTKLDAREGMQVAKYAVLAQIDEQTPLIAKKVALAEHVAAKAQADNDISVQFSIAAADVAKQEWQMAVDSENRLKGAIAKAEMNRLELTWKKAALQIKQSQLEKQIAGLTADAKLAEVEKSDNDLARRKIKAPVDGVVIAVLKHEGEWVQPGEPVLRLVRVDRLRIEGAIKASDFDPQEVSDKPVMIEVGLARDRRVRFEGKIVFVSPLVEGDGKYAVWAEVANRQENGQWVLRPGLSADMTIQLK